MHYPKHLKRQAVLGSLDASEAAGVGRAMHSIHAPLFLKSWPKVYRAFYGASRPLNWIWALVRAIVQRVARLFGANVQLPETPPEPAQPAASLSNEAMPGHEQAAARNVADACAEAAAQSNAFLEELLASWPNRDRLKDVAGSAFLSNVLTGLGTRLELLREQHAAAQQQLYAAAQPIAGELRVDVTKVLLLAQQHPEGGTMAVIGPLWQAYAATESELRRVGESFCNYCIVALRDQDGVDQEAVNEVAQQAIEKWADEAMRQRIRSAVAAPALGNHLGVADVPEAAEPAASRRATGAADEPKSGGFASLMERLRKNGVMEEDAAFDPNSGEAPGPSDPQEKQR